MNPPLRGPRARRGLHRRAERRHDRRDLQRPRPARGRKEDARSSTWPRSASSAWRRRWAWSSRKLIEPGHLDWPAALAKLTINPARILGINKGTLAVGADADVTIIDPDARWTVDPPVPLEEPQHAVRGLGAPRPGGHGDRRRPGKIRCGNRLMMCATKLARDENAFVSSSRIAASMQCHTADHARLHPAHPLPSCALVLLLPPRCPSSSTATTCCT